MANDDFDFDPEQAMDQLSKVKATSAAKVFAKGIKGPAGDALEYAADIVDTSDDGLSTTQMATEIADSLGMDLETLKLESELVKNATYYHENGDAMLNTTLGAARDLAIAAVPGGTIYLAGEGFWNYSNAVEEPNPTGDLKVLYNFSKNKNPTASDVMEAIRAKINPDARHNLSHYGSDGIGADKAIDPYIGDLIGPDFISGDGISKAEYIAEKIRIGEYAPEALTLNYPVPMRPIQRSLEEELEQEVEPEEAVAVNSSGKLNYSNSVDDVGYDEPLAKPRTPAVKIDPRSRTTNSKF
jgi:hypothetical protein